MTKKSDAPAIRFKGFSDAWEQRKLSEMCGTFEYGLNAAAKEFDGNNKYIRITDIDDASREFLLSDLSSPDICLDGMSKYLLSSGDIVFARTGASVGKTYIYRENDGIVYFAGFLIRAKVNQDNDAEFVFQSTLSPSYEKYIRITSQRSGQPGVNAQEYGEYDLFAPSKEEQQRIGHFLRGIDNLITLHQRKCVFLFSFFRACISMNFTASTFSWEQRKLGDIADIVGGGTPSTGNQSYWDGDIDWYAPAEIADQIYANSSQKKITGLGYENSSAKMLPPGTVLFTSRAGIGKTAILTRKGCTNQGFQSIVPHRGELDSYFIFSRTEELKRYGELVGAGSTFVEVSGKQMAVMELMMPPTMREQQTIGGFFQQLDHLITLHQRKGKAAVSGCFLNCSSLEKSSAQSRTLELFGQASNQEIKYIIDGLSILGGKLRNFCVKLIILLSYTRINDIAKYHISRNTECVHNIN